MQAPAQNYQRELTDDYHAFYERTGLIYDYQELEKLGFHMFSFSGHFMASSIPVLLDFLEKKPCYHLISVTRPGLYENRYVPDKEGLYYLADGDQNPHLVLYLFLRKNPELFAEEGFAEALAIIADVNGGHKGQ